MAADDCYEFGVLAYDNKNYVLAAQWMEESRKRLNDPRVIITDIYVHTMSYLAYANYEIGNIRLYH